MGGHGPCAIRWSNGQVDRADTWQALLDRVRADQFREYDEDEFRQVLASRAYRWSLEKIDAEADPEQLFRELAWARLIEFVHNDDNKEK